MVVLLCPGQLLSTLLHSVDSSVSHAQFWYRERKPASVSPFGAFTVVAMDTLMASRKGVQEWNLLSPFFPLFFSWGDFGIWIQDLCSPLWQKRSSRQKPDRARKKHRRQFCGNASLELIRMEELPCSVHEKQWSWKTEAAGSRDQFLTKKGMSPITSLGKKLT